MVKKIKCDRCGQEVEGVEIKDYATGGFYRLKGCWEGYRRNEREEVICDECMWADPKYIAVYGLHKPTGGCLC